MLEVGTELGHNDPYYFSRLFKKIKVAPPPRTAKPVRGTITTRWKTSRLFPTGLSFPLVIQAGKVDALHPCGKGLPIVAAADRDF